jgi:hypothetical protein
MIFGEGSFTERASSMWTLTLRLETVSRDTVLSHDLLEGAYLHAGLLATWS